MLRNRTYLLLAFVVVAMVCGAQTRRQRHDSQRDFIYLTGALGYQGLMNDDPSLTGKPAVGLQLGFGYRYYRNHFIFSLGAEARYGTYHVGALDTQMNLSMLDTEGYPFTMNVDISDRKDILHAADLQVPLLLGGEWAHFYFMLGAKASLNMYGSALTKAALTTTGTYDRYPDDFADMPNHGLYAGQPMMSERQSIRFKPQVLATLEVGYRLGEFSVASGADVFKPKTRYYIAGFAEFGVLNMHKPSGDGAPITMQMDDQKGLSFQVAPAYNTANYADVAVRNYTVGLKLTILFELPKPGICVICKEHDRHASRRF